MNEPTEEEIEEMRRAYEAEQRAQGGPDDDEADLT